MAAKTFALVLCLLAAAPAGAQSDAAVVVMESSSAAALPADSNAVPVVELTASDVAPLTADGSSDVTLPTLSAVDPSPSSDAQPLRRLLQDSVVDAPSDASDADALVTGFVAYDIDAQISAKLAASAGMNATALYTTSFRGVCTSLCRPHASSTSLDAGRRMLELCDNCWCRQNRPCTVSPPYGVCIACMDDWSSCAPTTSHYTVNDPANLKIRAACEAKKPVEAADALAGSVAAPPDVNTSLLADGTTVAGAPARKLLRA